MLRRHPFVSVFLAVLAAGVLCIGCDPKIGAEDLTGVGDGTGGGGDDGGSFVIPEEVEALGNLIALHLDLIHASLQEAVAFDDSAATPMPLRSLLPDGCITTTLVDGIAPMYSVQVDSSATCIDTQGTEYRGSMRLVPSESLDGYMLEPRWTGPELLRATNDAKEHLNHNVYQGAIWFTFQRGAGGDAYGAVVSNYLKHQMLGTVTSVSYVDVVYGGAPGTPDSWPSSGGIVRIGWDGYPNVDVALSGTNLGTFEYSAANYNLDLGTGVVTADTD